MNEKCFNSINQDAGTIEAIIDQPFTVQRGKGKEAYTPQPSMLSK